MDFSNFSYKCIWPKKMILTKEGLMGWDDTGEVVASKVVTCRDTGKWDVDILKHTCTKPCPIPKLDDPTIMSNDKNKTEFFNEYRETVK